MTVHFDAATLVVFLLALVRATAWVAICPPFATSGVPSLVKLGVGGGLALAVTAHLGVGGPVDLPVPTTTLGFVGASLESVLTGVVLGFSTNVLFSALAAAGSLIDVATGLNLTAAMDPLSLQQEPVIGRFYGLLATTLLFASDGYLLLVKGFLVSFQARPLAFSSLGSVSALVLGDVATMFLSALELSAPILAVLFLSDVVMGMLARAAPALNLLTLSMGLKVLLGILLLTLAIPLLPGASSHLIDQAIRGGLGILRR